MKIIRLLLTLLAFLSASSWASSISGIDVQVRLNDDGSASITQIWQVDVYGKGSEFYIPQGNLGDMEILDFSVTDETGRKFVSEGTNWDSKRSAAEKTGRYGMVKTNQGFELCWGRGEEGKHTYHVNWTFTHAIKAYDDYDGFNLRLVNDKLSPLPEKLKITLEKPGHPFVPGTVHMWAFGFRGTIFPIDGKIVVTPEMGVFQKENHVTVMLRFDKGLFNPLSKVAGSFQALADKAMEGVETDASPTEGGETKKDPWYVFFLGIIFILLLFWFLLILPLRWLLFRLPRNIVLRIRYGPASQRIKQPLKTFGNLDGKALKKAEAANWHREIPCNGSLLATNLLIQQTSLARTIKKTSLVEAFFLRLIQKGLLQIQQSPEESGKISLLAKRDDAVLATLTKKEAVLFRMLCKAAGSNGVLEMDEFSTWGKKRKNAVQLRDWMNWEATAMEELRMAGWSTKKEISRKKWFGLFGNDEKVKMLTDDGLEMLQKTIGFRQYLLDFTLVNEKRAVEVALWDDYLVFASLFNCTQKVSAEFLKLKPDFAASSLLLNTVSSTSQGSVVGISSIAGVISTYSDYRESSSSSSYSSSSYSSSSYSSSDGGSSYDSGGGGSSGGGSGGGER